MLGYSSTVLKALGFYTFLCTNGIPANNTNSTNGTSATNQTTTQTASPITKVDGTSVGGIVAAVVVTVVVTIVGIVITAMCIVKRRNKIAND